MSQHTAPTPVTPDQEITSLSVLLGRLMWALLGPMLLLLSTYAIIFVGKGWFTRWDAIFGGLVVLMLAGRWLEHRSGSATTITGEPATAEQYHRYLILLPAVAVILWLVANVVNNLILA